MARLAITPCDQVPTIISIVPVIVLFALVQRVMVAGIAAGAVKG